MKKVLSLLMALLMLTLCLVSCANETPETPAGSEEGSESESVSESETEDVLDNYIEMITYNIAYYKAAGNMQVYYKNQTIDDYGFLKRAQRLDAMVAYFKPDVLALQEVNHLWWPHIISGETPIVEKYGYAYEAGESSYGKKSGLQSSQDHDMFNLLLWNEKKFEKIKSGVIRLTDNKTDANKDRMCTYAILKNRGTGIETLFASVHLCTQGTAETERLNHEQSKKLMTSLESLANGRMIILGGDFNANANDPSYIHVTQTKGFLDGRKNAEERKTQSMGTARVWGKDTGWNSGRLPIDHILYKGTTAVAEEWKVMTDTYDKDNNVSTEIGKIGINYDLSDHQGVYTRFREVMG